MTLEEFKALKLGDQIVTDDHPERPGTVNKRSKLPGKQWAIIVRWNIGGRAWIHQNDAAHLARWSEK